MDERGLLRAGEPESLGGLHRSHQGGGRKILALCAARRAFRGPPRAGGALGAET